MGYNVYGSTVEGIAQDNIIYVGKHGDDSSSGTQIELAKLTFGAAITAAAALIPASDNRVAIVCCDAGEYTEDLTIPEWCGVIGQACKIIGNHTIADNALLESFRLVASTGNCVSKTAGAGDSTVMCERMILSGTAGGVLCSSGNINYKGSSVVVENGVAFASTTTARAHIELQNIDITGTGYGVLLVASGTLYITCGSISNSTGTALFCAGTGIIYAHINLIDCLNAYNVGAGSTLNLICASLSGTKTNAGTVNYLVADEGISTHGDITTAGNFIGELGETKEPTGFTAPEDVIVTGDPVARTVTLTGTVNAYYKGFLNSTIVTGWTSGAHDNTTTKAYALTYNGTDIDWRDLSTLTDRAYFPTLLIAVAFYNSSDATWVYNRECHGLMQWQSHLELHNTIGTYRVSGGTLADYVLASTTASERRPSVSSTILYDEDLPTTVTALPVNTYTQAYLSGAGAVINFNTTGTDIVPLSTNRPYWNEFTGGAWQQTLMSVGDYMNIWLLALPVAADTESQKLRYLWVQGQNEFGTTEDASAETTNDVNLGTLTDLAPELVFISKVTIRYIGGNWKFIEVVDLTGTKLSQAQSPTGNYLSSVTTDGTLTGAGTSGSPLSVTNATLTTALTVDTGTVDLKGNVANTSVLTLGAGASSVSGSNTGDQTTVSGNAGTATALATARAIYGNNFDGTAALTQIIASTYGGTGNGFTKFTGATTAEKTYTLPDSNATILYSGGDAGTPSALVGTNISGTASSLNIGGNAATVSTITGLAPDTATTQATQPNITSLGTLTDLNITNNQNALTKVGLTNTTNDTGAYSAFRLTNDTDTAFLAAFSSGYTTAGAAIANKVVLSDGGNHAGLNFAATKADGTITFMTGGANERVRIDSAGNVGIGTIVPDNLFHISSQTAGKGIIVQQSSSSDQNGIVTVRKSSGTIASPTVVTTGHALGQYTFQGYDGDTWETSADILALATGTIADGQVPSEMRFRTTTTGGSLTTAMTINSSQNVGIGMTPTKKLHVAGTMESKESYTTAYSATTGIAPRLNIYNDSAVTATRYSGLQLSQGATNVTNLLSVTNSGGAYGDFVIQQYIGTYVESMRLSSGGGLYLREIAAADTDIAAKGQIWVKNTTPNELWFTDDAGTDTQLGVGGGGGGYELGLNDANTEFGYTIQTYAGYYSTIDCTVNDNPGNMYVTSSNDTWQAAGELMGVSAAVLVWSDTGKTTTLEFRHQVAVADANDQTWGLTENNFYSAYDSITEAVCFSINGSTLYARTADGSTATTTDISSGITVTNWNVYKIVWTPGTNALFYVNGVLKATHTTNLPSTGTCRFGLGGTTNGQQQRCSTVMALQIV